jgi:hypothetical protein
MLDSKLYYPQQADYIHILEGHITFHCIKNYTDMASTLAWTYLSFQLIRCTIRMISF